MSGAGVDDGDGALLTLPRGYQGEPAVDAEAVRFVIAADDAGQLAADFGELGRDVETSPNLGSYAVSGAGDGRNAHPVWGRGGTRERGNVR